MGNAASPNPAGSTPRAQPPRPPEPSAAQIEADAEQGVQFRASEARERRSMIRGLLLLTLLILLLSIARAGLDRVFPQGWWRS